MKQEVVFDLETDWITHVCQDLLFSTARREDIQWDQGRDKLNNYISNIFLKHLNLGFMIFGSYVNNETKEQSYTLLHKMISGFVDMVISIHNLHLNRWKEKTEDTGKVKIADHFLNSTISKDFIKDLRSFFSLQKRIDLKQICMSSVKRLCCEMKTRYSSCEYNVPVIWLTKSQEVFRYFKLRCYLKKILAILQNEITDYVDIEWIFNQYYNQFCELTGLSDSRFTTITVLSSDITTLINNIEVLKHMVKSFQGLDTQYDLLCQIECKIQCIPPKSTSSGYSIKELIDPCFTPCFGCNYPSDANLLHQKVKDFLNSQFKSVKIDKVNHFINEVAAVTISCDDVEVFKSSQQGNSAFVLESFFCGVPYYLHFGGKNRWFCCILPATKPRELENNESTNANRIENLSRLSIKRNYRARDQEACIQATVDNIYSGEVNNSNVEGSLLRNITEESVFCRSQIQLSPANWLGREITTLVLRDFRFLGDKGIPILHNDVIHYIHPAILAFRFDNPAGDLLANSSGKQSSNMPCRDCKVTKQYWNKYSNTFTYVEEGDVLDDKKKRLLFLSTLTSLERDDLYRIISLINLFHQGEEKRIIEMLDSNESIINDRFCIEEIHRLLSICEQEHIVFWIPPTSVYYSPITKKFVEGTNPINTIGNVDLSITPNGNNTIKSKDSMHKIENTGQDFLRELVRKRSDMKDECIAFIDELKVDGVIPQSVLITTPSFSEYSIYYARYIYEMNIDYLPYSIKNIIEVLLPKKDKNSHSITVDSIHLNTNQKMHFTLIYAMFLFPGVIVDHYLYTYIRFFSVIGRMYSCRSDIQTFQKLYREMIFILNMIENERFFNSCSINDHLYIHDDLSYDYVGPPTEIDCFEPEWSFSDVKKVLPTPNSLITLYRKQMDVTITSIICRDCREKDVVLNTQIEVTAIPHFYRMSYNQFAIRVLSCYNSSRRYEESCACSIVTLWDIEAISTLENYLNGGLFNTVVSPRLTAANGNYLPSDDVTIEKFAFSISGEKWKTDIEKIPLLSCVHLFQTCSYNGVTFSSQNIAYSSMNREYFLNSNKKKCFGIVVDLHGLPHLVALLAFFSVTIDEKPYPMTYCHDIPISFIEDKPSQYVFKVDPVKSITPVHTIVSMDRIHEVNFIKAVITDEILGINDKLFSAQYV